MKTSRKEARYIQRIVVKVGSIQGVLDMMRYDSCYPETEEDAHKLTRIANGTAKDEDHIVNFIRAARTQSGPTAPRWASFACAVLDVQHPDEPHRQHVAPTKTTLHVFRVKKDNGKREWAIYSNDGKLLKKGTESKRVLVWRVIRALRLQPDQVKTVTYEPMRDSEMAMTMADIAQKRAAS
jgi:hypothetical protein